jgi:hypothetical protein
MGRVLTAVRSMAQTSPALVPNCKAIPLLLVEQTQVNPTTTSWSADESYGEDSSRCPATSPSRRHDSTQSLLTVALGVSLSVQTTLHNKRQSISGCTTTLSSPSCCASAASAGARLLAPRQCLWVLTLMRERRSLWRGFALYPDHKIFQQHSNDVRVGTETSSKNNTMVSVIPDACRAFAVLTGMQSVRTYAHAHVTITSPAATFLY